MFMPKQVVTTPERLLDHTLNRPPAAGGATISPNGTVLEAGMFVPGPDGLRLVYGFAGDKVIYILLEGDGQTKSWGGMWSQLKYMFFWECDFGGTSNLLRKKLAATSAVTKSWLEGFTTAVGCVGGPVGWAVFGMNAAVTTGKVWQNWKSIEDGMVAILVLEEETRAMKNFRRIVITNLLLKHVQDKAVGTVVELIEKPLTRKLPGGDVGAKFAGAIVGSLGEAVLAKRLELLTKLFEKVCIPVCKHLLDTNTPLSKEQIQQLAFHHVVPDLTEGGYEITQATGELLVTELSQHGKFLGGSFKKVVAALKAME